MTSKEQPLIEPLIPSYISLKKPLTCHFILFAHLTGFANFCSYVHVFLHQLSQLASNRPEGAANLNRLSQAYLTLRRNLKVLMLL